MVQATGGPGCCTVQVVLATVHCRWSWLTYTVGGSGYRWSRLLYSAGGPDCRALQVFQAVVHHMWCRLSYTTTIPATITTTTTTTTTTPRHYQKPLTKRKYNYGTILEATVPDYSITWKYSASALMQWRSLSFEFTDLAMS